MPVAKRATCVGPEEIENELETINLTVPSFQSWFGAECILSPHALFLFMQPALRFSLPFSNALMSFLFSSSATWTYMQVTLSNSLKLSQSFALLMLLWLFPLCVNKPDSSLPESWLTQTFTALHSAVFPLWAQHQWNHTDVDTMAVLPDGYSFVVKSRKAKPRSVTCFISYETLQSIRHGKCTI